MGVKFANWFVKITAWPVQKILLRLRISYENPELKRIYTHGPFILVCKHNSVYDYAALMFAFFRRTLRVQMAEVLFQKPVLGRFLRMLGGIRVDRNAHSFSCIHESQHLLENGWVVGIFPEGRLALPGETKPLAFQPGAALLALETGVPVIPVAVSGVYFRESIHIRIGAPLYLRQLTTEQDEPGKTVNEATRLLREKVIALREEMDREP